MMTQFIPPNLCVPEIAYGIISGFPVHDTYPLEDREKLDKLFREDYFAWEAMSRAAISRFAKNRSDAEARIAPSPFSHYRVNGWWEYEGRRIVDNGFILFGPADALHDFMRGYNRPYILKTETQTETVSLFSDQGSEVDSVYVGDLEDSREIISRVYSFLRPGVIFGTYTVAEFAGSFSHSWIDVLGNFVRHIRQNGEAAPAWQDSIVINDERGRREIKLLDHPRLKNCTITNRPTFGNVLGLIMAGPTPPPPLIETSEACNHLRKHLRVRGTVSEIGANRRGDLILRFGSAQADFKAVIPASCVLSKEEEWINSLKNRTLTVSGLISFYAQEPSMRIWDKNQIDLLQE
jgi:hypothetical protein